MSAFGETRGFAMFRRKGDVVAAVGSFAIDDEAQCAAVTVLSFEEAEQIALLADAAFKAKYGFFCTPTVSWLGSQEIASLRVDLADARRQVVSIETKLRSKGVKP